MAADNDPVVFKVVESRAVLAPGQNTVYLVEDGWDDWFTYSTMYSLVTFNSEKVRQRVGSVKIGQFGMTSNSGQRRPNLPKEFTDLDDSFFSLGQDADYYETLNGLEDFLRDAILEVLRDFAADLSIWEKAKTEDVTRLSLTRGISRTEVEGQLHRIANGGVRLTPYHFTYTAPKRTQRGQEEIRMEFDVEPESFPPTNIHVLIGRNGVGKTHTFNLMVKALVGKRALASQSGHFSTILPMGVKLDSPFSNLVSVCFSAFDSFKLDPDDIDDNRIEYSYVGLRRSGQGALSKSPKSPELLAKEFVQAAIECGYGGKAKRWRDALETLETDSIFKSANVKSFIGGLDSEEEKEEAKVVFKKLSSGHQIVLLTITKLVNAVEERTLVLLDEPEGHLHPPLLSAFIRALSNLLYDRNGVALIATHSPVVVQEVPRNCVWKLHRSGHAAKAERPEIQTFGENVGILTREIFGYEVTDSGFHRIIKEVAENTRSYQQALNKFNGELGAEAKAILRVALLRKQQQENEESS